MQSRQTQQAWHQRLQLQKRQVSNQNLLLYTDRITSPLITGEFWVSSLYRQNYLAADHRRDFRYFVYKKYINYYICKHLHKIISLYILKHSHNQSKPFQVRLALRNVFNYTRNQMNIKRLLTERLRRCKILQHMDWSTCKVLHKLSLEPLNCLHFLVKQPKIQLAFWGLFWIDFPNLSQRYPHLLEIGSRD